MSNCVTVTVPATTANLGPGFDCLGAALTLYNRFHFIRVDGNPGTVAITVTGEEADRVGTDQTNLVYRAFAHVFSQLAQSVPAISLTIDLGVPLARGLGSSSTAIVGGLLGANHLAGQPLSQQELMTLAIALEGHPDNVVPALLGGCRLAAGGTDQPWTICDVPWHSDIIPVVAIPGFELSTEEARQVLPPTYSRAEAIFNLSRLGLLLRGLETGQGDWLGPAMTDRIHQPYRKALIVGYDTVQTAALDAGAYGMVISGAGPTLLALAPPEQADLVQQAMADSWQSLGQVVTAYRLKLDMQGSRVELKD